MRRATGPLAALSVVFLLAACEPRFLPTEYVSPAPPPLQPYMGPSAAWAAPAQVVRKRVVRRHVRHHYRRRHRVPVNCPCIPAAPK